MSRADMGTRGQFWYWLARGSGIWLHLGRALRSPTAGSFSPGCEYAVAHGYDTLMLYSDENVGSEASSAQRGSRSGGALLYGGAFVEAVDCRAAARGASLDELWEGPCPPPNASILRTGWPNRGRGARGERRWSCTCTCDPSYSYLNCLG